MRMLALLILLFLANSLLAQNAIPEKAEKAYREGKELLRKQQPDKALKAFNKAVDLHPEYYLAIAERARIMLEKQDESAEKDLLLLTQLDPSKDPSVWFALAIMAKDQKRMEDAAMYYGQFLKYAPASHRQYNYVVREKANALFAAHALKNPVAFDPQRLPDAINNPNALQYGPMFRVDGQFLVFTRRIGGQEDFYYTYKEDSVWHDARPLEALNTIQNEGMHSLSRDGQTLIFTWCHDRQGMGSCDLYQSQLQKSADSYGMNWQTPKNLGANINTAHWDAQPSLSADGNILIFSSTRPGGKGESDLWWSHKNQEGHWGKAEPLPGMVNTTGKEQSPFLHADGRTLYFASDGHPGMGDMDLFVSHYDRDKGWQTPINLGYPINTEGHEGAMCLEMDGKTAYFATDRFQRESGGFGLFIYQFELPEAVRGTPVSYVQGRITDAVTKRAIPGRVHFYRYKSEKEEISFLANSQGEFLVCLPSGEDYGLQLDHPGYAFYSAQFQLSDSLSFKPYFLDVALSPIEMRESATSETRIILKNIHFPSGSADFLPESLFDLNRVLRFLQDYPKMRVRLEGHTDNVGNQEDNIKLSKMRAEAVRHWLVQKGIDPTRMESQGFGESMPISENTTKEGKQLNRRTEMVILP